MKPLVGISCCTKLFGTYGMPNHAASDTYVRAVDQVVDAVPILMPANGEAADIDTLLDRVDGIILTGSRSNVAPGFYAGPAHAEGTPEDVKRDRTTLPLIKAAVQRGVPVLAICRGLQEMNVALGGSLHQRLQDLPGRMDHSTPLHPDPRVRTGKAHSVRVTAGSWLHRLTGMSVLDVNSLHNQGIDRLAPGLVIEGVAPDGTVEAVRYPGGPGFAVGVQWHPEYDFGTDAVSRSIFAAFGAALRGERAALAGRLTLEARPAVAADLAFVVAVTTAAYAEYAPILDAPPLPVTEDYVPRIAAGEVFVISRDGTDLGAITVETHADHLMVFSLAVDPARRGGVGRWMLGWVEQRARQTGRPQVRLYTNGKMTRNIEVYALAGYRETGRQDNPKRPGWVAVHMAKDV